MNSDTAEKVTYQPGTTVIDCGEEGEIQRVETQPNGRETYYIEFDELKKVDEKELELGIADGTVRVIP